MIVIFLPRYFNPNHTFCAREYFEDSPYRALQPFHEADEELFFGRQEVVEQLQQRVVLREQPLLVIDGPSGSGKTSLIQAGLIPTLREERPT